MIHLPERAMYSVCRFNTMSARVDHSICVCVCVCVLYIFILVRIDELLCDVSSVVHHSGYRFTKFMKIGGFKFSVRRNQYIYLETSVSNWFRGKKTQSSQHFKNFLLSFINRESNITIQLFEKIQEYLLRFVNS